MATALWILIQDKDTVFPLCIPDYHNSETIYLVYLVKFEYVCVCNHLATKVFIGELLDTR